MGDFGIPEDWAGIRSRSHRFEVLPDQFRCPETQASESLRWVSKRYCDSFNQGEGCKYKATCKEYNKQ